MFSERRNDRFQTQLGASDIRLHVLLYRFLHQWLGQKKQVGRGGGRIYHSLCLQYASRWQDPQVLATVKKSMYFCWSTVKNHVKIHETISFKGTVTWDWDLLKFMLLDRSVLEEEPLVVFKIYTCSYKFKEMLTEMQPFNKKGWKLPRFSWQLLGNALKGYWTAVGLC